jgi:ketosteroid isomerase-like protein
MTRTASETVRELVDRATRLRNGDASQVEGSVDGRPLSTRCIFVVRAVAGLIVESRDYIDHLASARAYGVLPQVLDRLAGGAAQA